MCATTTWLIDHYSLMSVNSAQTTTSPYRSTHLQNSHLPQCSEGNIHRKAKLQIWLDHVLACTAALLTCLWGCQHLLLTQFIHYCTISPSPHLQLFQGKSKLCLDLALVLKTEPFWSLRALPKLSLLSPKVKLSIAHIHWRQLARIFIHTSYSELITL